MAWKCPWCQRDLEIAQDPVHGGEMLHCPNDNSWWTENYLIKKTYKHKKPMVEMAKPE